MTDKDIIYRIKELFGAGSIYDIARGVTYDSHDRKPQYKWQIGARKDVERFISYVYDWLGERRKMRLDEITEIYKQRKVV